MFRALLGKCKSEQWMTLPVRLPNTSQTSNWKQRRADQSRNLTVYISPEGSYILEISQQMLTVIPGTASSDLHLQMPCPPGLQGRQRSTTGAVQTKDRTLATTLNISLSAYKSIAMGTATVKFSLLRVLPLCHTRGRHSC